MEWTSMRFEQDYAYAESLEQDRQKKVKVIETPPEEPDPPKLTLSELREKRIKALSSQPPF
jgi:hypothetical protein